MKNSKSSWNVDSTHSEINFKVKHMMITNLRGSFGTYQASVETDGDDFSTAKVKFIIDVASIDTNNPQRNGHLLADDFFSAEKFPHITFESNGLKRVSDDEWIAKGNLTIRDVTKEVEFTVLSTGAMKDPWGMTRAGFDITGAINRKDFGMNFNMLIETGGAILSDVVKIEASLEFTKAVVEETVASI